MARSQPSTVAEEIVTVRSVPSTKLLYVLRHAKSSWSDATLPDHERPLSDRGHRDMRLLAEHIRIQGITPALVLCSSSRRTRETLEGVLPGREASVEPGLYAAGAEALLERLARVPPRTPSVLLVGHNPAAQRLVLVLAARRPRDDHKTPVLRIERKFPTGALATLAIDGEWAALAPGCGRLLDYVIPKRLG
jgi:phosphohistidine phosphatase